LDIYWMFRFSRYDKYDCILKMMSTPVHMRELCLYVLNCYICKIWYTNSISNTFLVRYTCKWI
jgi:hypothetical protein